MIWKGVGILGAAAGLVIVLVLGMAQLTVPDEPSFAEGFEEAAASPEDFVPSAFGGVLEVTGAREGIIELDEQVGGPSFGLGDGQARIFFTSEPLAIGQMSYDGLAFFPEPEDCEFVEGEHNEDAGLVAVQITCPELVDIRDNGSITLEGFAALPADLVIDLDLPEGGGSVTIGDETIDFGPDLSLFVGPTFDSGTSEMQLVAVSDSPSAMLAFPYDMETNRLQLGRIAYSGGNTDISPEECSHQMNELAVINPQAKIVELTFSCPEIQLANIGLVPIEGTLVFEQIYFAEP